MKKYIIPVLAIALLTGCKKEKEKKEEEETGYTVPSTYNFDNVSYSGQTNRLDMLAELTTYVKSAHVTSGIELDAEKMKDMFTGENDPFGDADLNLSSKNLQSKAYFEDTTYYIDLFDSIAAHSQILGAENGKAGIIETSSRIVLVDANGMEYAQLIDKGIMGSVFYYQGTSVYLSDEKIGDAVDNTTVTEGKGTPKEHHFDEAFGYFGAPKDFPTNTDDARFWASYCYKRDDLVNTNKIMSQFLKGRAAISNKDNDAQEAAVAEISQLWEKVSAATAIHYLNSGVSKFADDADRCHVLTEAYAFIKAIKYNVEATIPGSKVDEVLAALGDNFWDVTVTDIENAKNLLATAAGLESVKNSL